MDGFDERKHGTHRKMVELVGRNKDVLEVGCGSGFVSERLKQNGCSVTAIELNKAKALRAKVFCSSVIIGDVESMKMDFAGKRFDVILFGDVLEHLRDPLTVLKKVRPLLNDGGMLVASIPNIANWRVRLGLLFGKFDYAEQGLLDKTHLRFFTRNSARRLLNEAGYEIVHSDFTPSFPFPFFKRYLARLNPSMFAFQFIFAAKKR